MPEVKKLVPKPDLVMSELRCFLYIQYEGRHAVTLNLLNYY